MNKTRQMAIGKSGFVLCAALTAALTGCIGYVEPRGGGGAYVEAPPPAYVESQVVVQPEYVYYPDYQVYYSSRTRQYVYRDGRSWVSRSGPPRVSLDVLFASPSVSLGFHDHPSIHHAAVARQYPRHWAPAGQSRNQGRGGRD